MRWICAFFSLVKTIHTISATMEMFGNDIHAHESHKVRCKIPRLV